MILNPEYNIKRQRITKALSDADIQSRLIVGGNFLRQDVIKYFDYIACGKPVIAANVRPLKRLIEENQTGIVIDCDTKEKIAEGIIRICISDDLKKYSDNGIFAARNKYHWGIDFNYLFEIVTW